MLANHTPTRNVHSLIGALGVPITSFPTDGAYDLPRAGGVALASLGRIPSACVHWMGVWPLVAQRPYRRGRPTPR